jgi:hypothetical protein
MTKGYAGSTTIAALRNVCVCLNNGANIVLLFINKKYE